MKGNFSGQAGEAVSRVLGDAAFMLLAAGTKITNENLAATIAEQQREAPDLATELALDLLQYGHEIFTNSSE